MYFKRETMLEFHLFSFLKISLPDYQYFKLSVFWKKSPKMILELYGVFGEQTKSKQSSWNTWFLRLDSYYIFSPKLEDTSTLFKEICNKMSMVEKAPVQHKP